MNSELLCLCATARFDPGPTWRASTAPQCTSVDGRHAHFDAAICATGYWIDHPFFAKEVVDFLQSPVRLHLRMLSDRLKNPWFIGLFQPLGCIWPGAELQSKQAAAQPAGARTPPADLPAANDRELARPDWQQLPSPRHTVTVDGMAFCARVQRELPRQRVAAQAKAGAAAGAHGSVPTAPALNPCVIGAHRAIARGSRP